MIERLPRSTMLLPRTRSDGRELLLLAAQDAVALSVLFSAVAGFAFGASAAIAAALLGFVVSFSYGVYRSLSVSFRTEDRTWVVRDRWWTYRVDPQVVARLVPRNASLNGPPVMALVLNTGPPWWRWRGICIEATASPELDRLNENVRRVRELVE